MIDVVRCEPGHLKKIEPLDVLRSEIPFLYRLELSLSLEGSVAWTFMEKGNPIGCVGSVDAKDETVFWGWLGKDIKKYPTEFALKCTKKMNELIEDKKPHRLVMYVKKHHKDVVRWAKFLGFNLGDLVKAEDGFEYHKMVRELN